jgi:hypothetical protein
VHFPGGAGKKTKRSAKAGINNEAHGFAVDFAIHKDAFIVGLQRSQAKT